MYTERLRKPLNLFSREEKRKKQASCGARIPAQSASGRSRNSFAGRFGTYILSHSIAGALQVARAKLAVALTFTMR